MSLGWFTPTELNDTGSVKLDKLDDNIAFSVTNPKNPNEMFLLEYRTKKNWDRGQKSSGMLIWHIDYSDSVWKKGGINSDSNHIYVNIIEAVPETSTSAATTDPFPGSGKVTDFNKFIFWNGDDMKIALSNITESPDSNYITFTVDMTIRSSSSISSSSSVSSSSAAVSSSSVLSSSTTLSSSSNASSSSAHSSSSETIFSSSTAPSSSSSSVLDSSSSTEISSSSSDYTVFATHHTLAQNVKVRTHNGAIYIHAPQQGEKTVRIFSPIGTLLFEKTMDGTEFVVENVHELRNANVILSVKQGNKRLFTGMIAQN
jgi:hypothetical protein